MTYRRIYLLNATPDPTVAASAFIETVVAYGSKGTTDTSTPAQIIANIWKNFSSKQATDLQGKRLTYYASWPTGDPKAAVAKGSFPPSLAGSWPTGSLATMLQQTSDGMCGTWSWFLYSALRAQGIATKRVLITPKKPGEGFLIGPSLWTFNKPNVAKGIYSWQNQPQSVFTGPGGDSQDTLPWIQTAKKQLLFRTKDNKGAKIPLGFSYGGGSKTGNVGQNNKNPMPLFYNHAVVQIGGKLYDPSYGVVYDSLQQLQNQAVAGFFYVSKVKDANGSYIMSVRKPLPKKLELNSAVVND